MGLKTDKMSGINLINQLLFLTWHIKSKIKQSLNIRKILNFKFSINLCSYWFNSLKKSIVN